jgi:hypothetical protein
LHKRTFSMTNVPKGLLTQSVSTAGKLVGPAVSVHGFWKIGDGKGSSRNSSGLPFITLTFSDVSYASAIYLYVEGTGATVRLYAPYGDPDSQTNFTFTK